MEDVTRLEREYKVYGVPTQYIREHTAPLATQTVMNAYNLLIEKPGRLRDKPLVLFFHSVSETGALKAASNIAKSGIAESVHVRMVSFPEYLQTLKESWDNRSDDKKTIEKINNCDLLVLTMVGKEYTTEFTIPTLTSLIEVRRGAGKSTIVTSSMDLAAFKSRYSYDPSAAVLKFEDPTSTDNIRSLVSFLEGSN